MTTENQATIVDAQLVLGQLALDQHDHAAAIEWFRAAARGGDRRGWNMLGRCAERGWGTAANAADAARYYRQAADLGDAWGMFNLADLYGRGLGVDRDDKAAFSLYAEAAKLGHVKSLNMLGLIYEDGQSVAADREQARAFFQAGAEGDDCWAQFNLARLAIEEGHVAQALPWLERTFDTGFVNFWQHLQAALADHADPRLQAIGRRAGQLAGQGGA